MKPVNQDGRLNSVSDIAPENPTIPATTGKNNKETRMPSYIICTQITDPQEAKTGKHGRVGKHGVFGKRNHSHLEPTSIP